MFLKVFIFIDKLDFEKENNYSAHISATLDEVLQYLQTYVQTINQHNV